MMKKDMAMIRRAVGELQTRGNTPPLFQNSLRVYKKGKFSVSQLLAGTELENLSGVDIVDLPARSFHHAAHTHNKAYTVIHVLDGYGIFLVGNGMFFVAPGNNFVIPRGVKHDVYTLQYGLRFISVQHPPIKRGDIEDYHPIENFEFSTEQKLYVITCYVLVERARGRIKEKELGRKKLPELGCEMHGEGYNLFRQLISTEMGYGGWVEMKDHISLNGVFRYVTEGIRG